MVAMAYSVYAVAAAEFMAAFYERLFAGGTVSAAVTAGRQQLYRQSRRPSPKGDLPLADWLVPVHYLRREVQLPAGLVTGPAELPSLEEALAATAATGSARRAAATWTPVEGCSSAGTRCSTSWRPRPGCRRWWSCTGPGGTGKTELAKAFGRWWRDTGGVERPEWVFWHSFEPGVASFGLDGVITEIGLACSATDFARLEPAQRRAVVRRRWREHRMLLIWDNFEIGPLDARSGPRPRPPLDEAGCAELRELPGDGWPRAARSAVLVTSRDRPRDWLGDIRRIAVGGLAAHEAAEYAEHPAGALPGGRASGGRAGRSAS